MKLVTIVIGTRPEAIKLAPVAKIFSISKLVKLRVILTGQHQEMVKKIMELFGIPISEDLNVMEKGQSLSKLSSRILEGMEREFDINKPSFVIVQGDTTTAFITSLAAFYQKIKVAHVEAGLRTEDILNPFPEEANRRLISQVACLHFAPTHKALENLIHTKVLGKICGVNARWGSYLPDWHPWENYRSFYMAKKDQGGGALYDECHGIDLMRYFFGEISEVSAFVGNTSKLKISRTWNSISLC